MLFTMKTSKPAERYWYARKVLCCHNATKRKKYIKKATPEQVKGLVECVQNTYLGNVPLSEEELNALKPFQEQFEEILSKRRNIQRHRKLLVQQGGFLPLLAGALIPILTELIAKNM